jgi:hypothetical protein
LSPFALLPELTPLNQEGSAGAEGNHQQQRNGRLSEPSQPAAGVALGEDVETMG